MYECKQYSSCCGCVLKCQCKDAMVTLVPFALPKLFFEAFKNIYFIIISSLLVNKVQLSFTDSPNIFLQDLQCHGSN